MNDSGMQTIWSPSYNKPKKGEIGQWSRFMELDTGRIWQLEESGWVIIGTFSFVGQVGTPNGRTP